MVSAQLLSNNLPDVLQHSGGVLHTTPQVDFPCDLERSGACVVVERQAGSKQSTLTAALTIMRLHRTERDIGRLIRAEPRTLVACNSKTDRLKLPINNRTRLLARDADDRQVSDSRSSTE